MATCKKGTVAWECLYPSVCTCSPCCCQGANCVTPCSQGALCTQGGCCNGGRNSQWDYAWKSNNAFGIHLPCGANASFTTACGSWALGTRADSGPGAPAHIADLTKAFFMFFAPLSQGTIQNMRVTTNTGCC